MDTAGGAVTTGAGVDEALRWSGWFPPQPATATPATRRIVAIRRMGRIMVIPFETQEYLAGPKPLSQARVTDPDR
jgi:hypothetical protein